MIIRQLAVTAALAAAFLAAVMGLRYAENAELLDAGAAKRGLQIIFGLGLAVYANAMPKQIGSARRSPRVQMHTQAALRVGGWSFTLASLAYAGLWAFTTPSVAQTAGMIVIAAAMATTLGYALWSFTACRRIAPTPGGRWVCHWGPRSCWA